MYSFNKTSLKFVYMKTFLYSTHVIYIILMYSNTYINYLFLNSNINLIALFNNNN